MRTTTIAVLAGLAALTAPLAAQTQYNAAVAVVMSNNGGKYQVPLCPLKGGDYRTSSAGTYMKTAIEGFKDPAGAGASQVNSKTYTDGMKKAINQATDAVKANPGSAAAWYYLGRASLYLGDLRGADSAFTQLEKLSPDCSEEIKSMRQKAWLVLVNPSAEYLKKSQFDSALMVLRDANIIARYYPQGYYNLGATFANMKPSQPDSAIYYFTIAVEKAGNDPTLAATLKGSVYNMGFLYQAMGKFPEAIAQYRKYLTIDPNDESVKRSLASTLRLTGNTAEAVQIENQLMAGGKLNNNEMMTVGVRLFNEKDYAGAADAFKKVLATDATNHDALFNLTNAYLALEDSTNLIASAKKLLEADPLNQNNLKLLANGYRISKNVDKQLEVVTVMMAMTYNVSVEKFAPRKDGAKLSGTFTGVEGRNNSDKVIAPTAATLVFEFTDATGAVVATQEVAVTPLAPNAKQELSIDVTGAGITGWKYHKK